MEKLVQNKPKCYRYGSDNYKNVCLSLQNSRDYVYHQINYGNSNKYSGKTGNNVQQYKSENNWKFTKPKEKEPQTKVVENTIYNGSTNAEDGHQVLIFTVSMSIRKGKIIIMRSLLKQVVEKGTLLGRRPIRT